MFHGLSEMLKYVEITWSHDVGCKWCKVNKKLKIFLVVSQN